MNKRTKQIVIILMVLLVIYMIYMWNKRIDYDSKLQSDHSWQNVSDLTNSQTILNVTSQGRGNQFLNAVQGKCVKPNFINKDLSGRSCAGTEINENKTLKLGDESCEVLLLQQRLNSMQSDSYILKPTGQFCCHTKFKLNMLMGVPQISLNRFSPDEQIGFNSLEGGTKLTPYSYMDVNTKII